MKHESKQHNQEQEKTNSSAAQQEAMREFANTEELLNRDASQTEVPPVIAERLTKSIQVLPPPSKSWWERLLNR